LIQGYRELGFYTIKHTDGNIMPILDQLVEANPMPCTPSTRKPGWTLPRSNGAVATGCA
jgi:hypothetical protein